MASDSMQTIANVTYYVAWLSTACGAAVHFIKPLEGVFRVVELTQRNLLEGAVLLFLISAVSLHRASQARVN
jgi:hypothetical protein